MASSAKSPGALFRPCPGCESGKIYREDTHSLCIYCLYMEAHVISGCEICQAFPSGTRRDRAMRVAARFSTSTGKKSPSPPSPSDEDRDSSEPPHKKRALDQSAGGSRSTHKSSRPTTHPKQGTPAPSKDGSRWDVQHGGRKPPSTEGALPSPGSDPRRQSPSTAKAPSTTVAQQTPGLGTPTALVQTDTRDHAPPQKVPPLRMVTVTQGTGPPQTGDRPMVGHKTLPTPIDKTAPRKEAWQQSLDLAMGTIKVMVDQHQKSLKRVKSRLAEQQEASKVSSQQESVRVQALLTQQQNMFREELRMFQDEAEKRETDRSDRFRREMEELRRSCTQPASDPVQDLQNRELEALKRRQEKEKETVVYTVYSDDEEGDDDGDEEDPYDPDNEPYEPVDDPPTGPSDPHGDEPELPVDIGGLPRSPTPRPTPLEDGPSFSALIQRAASHFSLELEKTKPSDSYLLDKLEEPIKTTAALPIEPLVWDSGVAIMSAPATAQAVSARIDRKYRVPTTAKVCFRAQPSAESIISSSAKGTSQVAANVLAPPTKEARRLDNVGKKVLAAASAAVRAANYTAVLARYDREMWDNMALALTDLPPENREAANKVLDEGRLVSNSLVRAALDSADCGFRQMNNGVWLRRMGWLSSSTFNQEYHPRILDLPFDGEHVFGPEVDKVLMEQKTVKETIKAMSPLTRGRGNFRGNRRAGRRTFNQAFPQQQQIQQTAQQAQFQYPNPFPQAYPQQRGSGGGRQGGRPRRGGANRGNRGPKTQ